jgi:hypothetical protein
MGFFQRLFSPASARAELLEELAVIAGRNQGLVDRLKRHAPLSGVSIRAGVEELAEKEAAHVKLLNSILADHNVWAKLPEPALHDGSNNWERLSGDLAVLAELASDLRTNAMKWESVDEDVVVNLRQLAIEADSHESELRKLAMKCDTLALD